MPINTKELARKLIESGDLEKAKYSLQQLFRVRDCLLMLKSINPLFCDEGLLQETLKFIAQKAGINE